MSREISSHSEIKTKTDVKLNKMPTGLNVSETQQAALYMQPHNTITIILLYIDTRHQNYT